jgi:hypothetical protein
LTPAIKNQSLDFADTRSQNHTLAHDEDTKTQNKQIKYITTNQEETMPTQSNTRSQNCTLNGDIVILYAATSRGRSMPARTQTRDNQRLIISTTGNVSVQNRNVETDLRAMFARLGATLTNERSRNGKFINPITKRQISVRKQTDISRLEKRVLARSRFNAVRQIQ